MLGPMQQPQKRDSTCQSTLCHRMMATTSSATPKTMTVQSGVRSGYSLNPLDRVRRSKPRTSAAMAALLVLRTEFTSNGTQSGAIRRIFFTMPLGRTGCHERSELP